MSSLFSKFYKSNSSKSIVCSEVISLIYSCLHYQSNRIIFKMKGIHDNVSVDLYSFPSSFNYDAARNEIEKRGFKSSYDVLNELYKKTDIIGGVPEEDILKGVEYYYIQIDFYSTTTPEVNKRFKRFLQHFIFLFCNSSNDEEISFRILHSNNFFVNYTKEILETQFIDINNPQTESQKLGFKDLEIVLQGICQYFEIKLPENIKLPSHENLLKEEINVTLEIFEEFLRLVSRGNIEEKLLKKQSKRIFKSFKDESKEDDEVFQENFDFFESLNTWNSDWKFDPEDAESFISEMIGEDLNFEYPEETYSDDLFPYIQSALEKRGLELMSYETNGDNYLFFVANKDDVARILELSELTKIEVESL